MCCWRPCAFISWSEGLHCAQQPVPSGAGPVLKHGRTTCFVVCKTAVDLSGCETAINNMTALSSSIHPGLRFARFLNPSRAFTQGSFTLSSPLTVQSGLPTCKQEGPHSSPAHRLPACFLPSGDLRSASAAFCEARAYEHVRAGCIHTCVASRQRRSLPCKVRAPRGGKVAWQARQMGHPLSGIRLLLWWCGSQNFATGSSKVLDLHNAGCLRKIT